MDISILETKKNVFFFCFFFVLIFSQKVINACGVVGT